MCAVVAVAALVDPAIAVLGSLQIAPETASAQLRDLANVGRSQSGSAAAPGCGLTWWMLAGVGKTESDHADGGVVDAGGTARNAVFGPWLDGSNGTAAIHGEEAWQRALGPMQFLPARWAAYGNGGDPRTSNPPTATPPAAPQHASAALYRQLSLVMTPAQAAEFLAARGLVAP